MPLNITGKNFSLSKKDGSVPPPPTPTPLSPVGEPDGHVPHDDTNYQDFYDLAGISETAEENDLERTLSEAPQSRSKTKLTRTKSESVKPRPQKIAPPRPPGKPTVGRSDKKVIQPRSRRYDMDGLDLEVPVSSMSTAPEATVDMRFCSELRDRQGLTFLEAYSSMLNAFSETGATSLNDAIFMRHGRESSLQDEDNLTHFGGLYRDFLIWVQVLARSERPDFPTVFPPLPWLSDVGMVAFSESIPFVERYVSMGAENINYQTHLVKTLDATLCDDLLRFLTAIDHDVRDHPLCYSNALCPITATLCTVSDDDDIIMDILYSQRRVAQINHSVALINAYQAVSYGKGGTAYLAPPSKTRYPMNEEMKRYCANLKAGLNKIKPKRRN